MRLISSLDMVPDLTKSYKWFYLHRENEYMPDRKIWILVVDDNLVVRKTTGKLLRKEGFEIILAEDGEEAMGLFELCTPDCVLL